MKVSKEEALNYAKLIKQVSEIAGDERAAKCGYDLFCGIANTDGIKTKERADAWKTYLTEVIKKESIDEGERDGVWVPAIPYRRLI